MGSLSKINNVYAVGLYLGPCLTCSVVAYAGQDESTVSCRFTQQRPPAQAVPPVVEVLIHSIEEDDGIGALNAGEQLNHGRLAIRRRSCARLQQQMEDGVGVVASHGVTTHRPGLAVPAEHRGGGLVDQGLDHDGGASQRQDSRQEGGMQLARVSLADDPLMPSLVVRAAVAQERGGAVRWGYIAVAAEGEEDAAHAGGGRLAMGFGVVAQAGGGRWALGRRGSGAGEAAGRGQMAESCGMTSVTVS